MAATFTSGLAKGRYSRKEYLPAVFTSLSLYHELPTLHQFKHKYKTSNHCYCIYLSYFIPLQQIT